MARPRKKSNRDLPLNLYYSKDTKAYRYKDTITDKWHNFGHDRQKGRLQELSATRLLN